MTPLPSSSTDADLIAYVDRWAALLEAEQYKAAFALTDHDASQRWTPQIMREVIAGYGDAIPGQKVTVVGRSTDIRQRKEVSRWSPNPFNQIGEVWYDLNIDGLVSDLTATFWIVQSADGLRLVLNDIHVM